MNRTVFLAAAVGLAGVCGLLFAQEVDPIVITVERTACLGPCPVYAVRITGDGRVEYTGTQIVRVAGSATAQASRAAVRHLADEFVRIGYFDFDNAYVATIDDISSTTTSIRI